MKGWIGLLVTVASLAAAVPLFAQDEVDDAVVEATEPPAREVVQAWATPVADADHAAEDLARESDSFSRIHDADEALLELEAARRMVGYDLMDGVR